METLHVISCLVIAFWSGWACLDARVPDGVLGKLALGGVALGALAVAGETLSGHKVMPGEVLLIGALAVVGAGHFLTVVGPYRGRDRRRNQEGGKHGHARTAP